MEKKKASRSRRLLQILCVILGLILAACLVCAVLLNTVLGRINRPDPSEPTLSDEQIEEILNQRDELDPIPTAPVQTVPSQTPGETQPEQTTAPTVEVTLPPATDDRITKSDHVINILLIGQDRRPGQGRQRSDSMILVTVNKQKQTLIMFQKSVEETLLMILSILLTIQKKNMLVLLKSQTTQLVKFIWKYSKMVLVLFLKELLVFQQSQLEMLDN